MNAAASISIGSHPNSLCHDGGMTSPVIQRWIDVVEGGRADVVDELLAEDAVFYSPAVFTPQEGRAKTAAYLKAAAKLFGAATFASSTSGMASVPRFWSSPPTSTVSTSTAST